MAKKVVAQIKLQIPAGKANPSPPVGPNSIRTARCEYNGVLQNI